MNTKGLKLIASPYGAHHDDQPFDAPLASRHRMIETLTVFDDVVVPHDRVFLNGEWEFAGELAKTFVEFHRFTAISYKLPLVDASGGRGAADDRIQRPGARQTHSRKARAADRAMRRLCVR